MVFSRRYFWSHTDFIRHIGWEVIPNVRCMFMSFASGVALLRTLRI